MTYSRHGVAATASFLLAIIAIGGVFIDVVIFIHAMCVGNVAGAIVSAAIILAFASTFGWNSR